MTETRSVRRLPADAMLNICEELGYEPGEVYAIRLHPSKAIVVHAVEGHLSSTVHPVEPT